MSPGGLERKRVYVEAPHAAELIRALASAGGVDVVDEPPVDLVVLEADEVEVVERVAKTAPCVLVVPRRLRSAERETLRAAGARRIVDHEGSILDVVFAISEALHATFVEQRRYESREGGLFVSFSSDASTGEGRIVGLARAGGFLETRERLAEGTRLSMNVKLAGHLAEIRGRVAYASEQGFGVEFDLGDRDVASRLYSLCS